MYVPPMFKPDRAASLAFAEARPQAFASEATGNEEAATLEGDM